jgi:hypothetical protein
MVASGGKFMSAGTRVRIEAPGPVPNWSTWDDDGQRTSTPVKRRLQQLFFNGDRKIQAEVVYVGNESERDRLRNLGRVKVQLRDPAGCMIVLTAEAASLKRL